jgi:hypothetical protein
MRPQSRCIYPITAESFDEILFVVNDDGYWQRRKVLRRACIVFLTRISVLTSIITGLGSVPSLLH